VTDVTIVLDAISGASAKREMLAPLVIFEWSGCNAVPIFPAFAYPVLEGRNITFDSCKSSFSTGSLGLLVTSCQRLAALIASSSSICTSRIQEMQIEARGDLRGREDAVSRL